MPKVTTPSGRGLSCAPSWRVSAPVRVSWLLRAAVLAAGIGGLAVATSSQADGERVVRVATLVQNAAPPVGISPSGPIARFLAELGYVEGRNLVFDRRWAAGDSSRFPALAADVVALKPDVIIAETTPGALAAKAATSTIPIIFFNVSDAVGAGLVTSVAHPGGNITGITDWGIESGLKSLEMLHECRRVYRASLS